MFGWWEKRRRAKIADRQRRWSLMQIQDYAGALYIFPADRQDSVRAIGLELLRLSCQIPPPDFK